MQADETALGEPRFIGLSVPHMAPDLAQALQDAFADNWVAHLGPQVDAFERELAAAVGVDSSFATNSGTAALHLALRVLDVGPGDTVFCSSLSFIASASPILYLGAEPVFIDVEPSSWGMSPRALERALEHARRTHRLPKAIVVVQLYGQSAPMDALQALARAYGVPLVEDAAQALGATYRGRSVGTLADLGIYSFAGNKIITTSTGGALVSRSPEHVARARFLGLQARLPGEHDRHAELGYNYRLSNVLAALGRSQLRVLHERVAARRRVFARYREALVDVPLLELMPEAPYGEPTHWLSVLLLPERGPAPEHVLSALAERGIETRRVFEPLHMQPLHAGRTYYAHDPAQSVSDRLFARGLCIPSSSSLRESEQVRVIDELKRLLLR